MKLSATTAFGNTVFAFAMIAKRRVYTLILVHNKALLEQWKERLDDFLEIQNTIDAPIGKRGRLRQDTIVGCLHSGKNTLRGVVDIALIQSCLNAGDAKHLLRIMEW